ncbi:MAG TPA: FAD:protein FMN transferase [Streptosporangiaceae bacterium]|nr:FAD:protein FMN transferase [Streptosporangiaceae bacterium]
MTVTSVPHRAAAAVWRRISTGDQAVAVAQRDALGTTARLAVWPPEHADAAMAAVDAVLAVLDRQASRFRPDSEISWLNSSAGGLFMLSDGLAEAVGVALEAARWTGGLADPTIGEALISLGYDRDFMTIDPDSREPLPAPVPAPGWWQVQLDGPLLHLPAGLMLDLGATAKGLGSDRAARAVLAATGHSGGALISLGGDIATAGIPPRGGWPIVAAGQSGHDGADPPGTGPAGTGLGQLVRLPCGAVATSSIGYRSWRRAGRVMHHIVDPRTGLPADGPWQTASVAAMTCADANAAATAAIVAGEAAAGWPAAAGLPARLVSHDGRVRYLGGWPEQDGGQIKVPQRSWVYAGAGPRGGMR